MDLNLNSPAHFSEEHGIDDEIYWFQRDISKYFKDKNYSEVIDTIGIISFVAPKEVIEQGLCKENVKIDKGCKLAIIAKQTDYLEYLNADIEGRKRLMVENILLAVEKIKKRGKFDYESFKKDMLEFVADKLHDDEN